MGTRGRKKRTKEEQIEAWTIRYGSDFMKDITAAKTRMGVTLTDIATKYNLTRQYISFMYEQIHGEKYFPLIKIKTKVMQEDLSCSCDPRNQFEMSKLRGVNDSSYRNTMARSKFIEKCIEKKISFKFNKEDKSIITINDNYNVFVLFTSIRQIQSIITYHIDVRKIQQRHPKFHTDFIFAYMFEEDKFFIIDLNQQYTAKTFYLSAISDTREESQYKRKCFIDRWDLIQNGAVK